MSGCHPECSEFESHRSLVDSYLSAIVGVFFAKHGMYPSDEGKKQYLSRMSENSELWAHWFKNCKMFHELPCVGCEYRFRCYTS